MQARDPASAARSVPGGGLTLFHAAPSRSSSVRAALEDIGAPYDVVRLDLKAGEHLQPDFLAVNPLGKVPALRHGEAVITEQVAIILYLADLFPEAGLAPAIGDPLRGPYLRWMVFYAASFEPALVDRALKREPGMRAMSPYGSFEAVAAALDAQLARGPHLLGERFTAADILWTVALRWMTGFGILPESEPVKTYLARTAARPCFARARALDEAEAPPPAAPDAAA